MVAKQHTFALSCPSCGGIAQADRTIKKITCSFCGSDLVIDPQSAVGKAVTLQSLLSIPGDVRQLEERRANLNQAVARLKKKIKAAEGEGYYSGLRTTSAIVLIILIYCYGSAFLGTIIHFGRVEVPQYLAILLAPAPLFALFVHNFPLIAWPLLALPIIGIIVAQTRLNRVPDEALEVLEGKLAGISSELITVNTTIREHREMLEIFRDVVPRLVG